jgi:hypothetical protein
VEDTKAGESMPWSPRGRSILHKCVPAPAP